MRPSPIRFVCGLLGIPIFVIGFYIVSTFIYCLSGIQGGSKSIVICPGSTIIPMLILGLCMCFGGILLPVLCGVCSFYRRSDYDTIDDDDTVV